MSDEKDVIKRNPPYISWDTFEKDVLGRIKARNPCRVTASTLEKDWHCGAKSTCTKFHSALVFLGIVNKDGSPNKQKWNDLSVSNRDAYRANVQAMIQEAYGPLIESLANWPAVDKTIVEDTIGELYGATKASRKVARAFLWQICDHAGIALGTAQTDQERDQEAVEAEPRQLEATVEPGPPTAFAQTSRARPAEVRISIAVDPNTTEDALVDLLRTVRAALRKVENDG